MLKPNNREMEFKERQKYILSAAADEIFKTEWVQVELPAKAKDCNYNCEECKEGQQKTKSVFKREENFA